MIEVFYWLFATRYSLLNPRFWPDSDPVCLDSPWSQAINPPPSGAGFLALFVFARNKVGLVLKRHRSGRADEALNNHND